MGLSALARAPVGMALACATTLAAATWGERAEALGFPAAVDGAGAPAEPAFVAGGTGPDPDTRAGPGTTSRLVAGILAARTAEGYPAGTTLAVPVALPAMGMGGDDGVTDPSKNGMCELHPGRTVRVMGGDREFGILVRHGMQGGREVRECAGGTLTFVAPATLGQWDRTPPTQDDIAARRRRTREAVDRIMGR